MIKELLRKKAQNLINRSPLPKGHLDSRVLMDSMLTDNLERRVQGMKQKPCCLQSKSLLSLK